MKPTIRQKTVSIPTSRKGWRWSMAFDHLFICMDIGVICVDIGGAVGDRLFALNSF
jgi:hypothetical protein